MQDAASLFQLECEAANSGGELPPDRWKTVLLPDISASPMLLKAYALFLCDEGREKEAKPILMQSLRGFGREAHPAEMLSASAILALVDLRLGDREEALTLLRFLLEETQHEGQVDGVSDALWAIAFGGDLLGISVKERQRYYENAVSGLIEQGKTRRSFEVWLELLHLIQASGTVNDSSRLFAEIRQRAGWGLEYEPHLTALRWMEAMAEGRWDTASSYASVLMDVPMSLYHRRLLETWAAVAAVESSRPKSLECSGPPMEAHPPLWSVRCFRQFTLSGPNAELHTLPWKRRKAQELFLYLLLRPGYFAPKEQVIEEVFASEESGAVPNPKHTANHLYVTVHQLKKVLEKQVGVKQAITIRDHTVRLSGEWLEEVDVEQYVTLIRVADQLEEGDQELSLEWYGKARELYGPLVPELQFIDWLDRIREQLEQKQIRLLQRLARHAVASGQTEQAEVLLREWLELAPTDESACQDLLRLLTAKGRISEAKRVYHEFEARMRKEWDETPMPETRHIAYGL